MFNEDDWRGTGYQAEARRNFKKTLRRFGIMKSNPVLEAMEAMSKIAMNNFGMPNQLFASPKTMEDFKGLNELLKRDKSKR